MNGAQVKDAIVFAIENRTISHKDDAKMAEYESGRYKGAWKAEIQDKLWTERS